MDSKLSAAWSFLSFVEAHVPEGRLRWKGVSIPRAVARFLWDTLVKVLKEVIHQKVAREALSASQDFFAHNS